MELSTKFSNLLSPFEEICRYSLGGKAAIDSSIFHLYLLFPKGEYIEQNSDHKHSTELLENNLGNMFGIGVIHELDKDGMLYIWKIVIHYLDSRLVQVNQIL